MPSRGAKSLQYRVSATSFCMFVLRLSLAAWLNTVQPRPTAMAQKAIEVVVVSARPGLQVFLWQMALDVVP